MRHYISGRAYRSLATCPKYFSIIGSISLLNREAITVFIRVTMLFSRICAMSPLSLMGARIVFIRESPSASQMPASGSRAFNSFLWSADSREVNDLSMTGKKSSSPLELKSLVSFSMTAYGFDRRQRTASAVVSSRESFRLQPRWVVSNIAR